MRPAPLQPTCSVACRMGTPLRTLRGANSHASRHTSTVLTACGAGREEARTGGSAGPRGAYRYCLSFSRPKLASLRRAHAARSVPRGSARFGCLTHASRLGFPSTHEAAP